MALGASYPVHLDDKAQGHKQWLLASVAQFQTAKRLSLCRVEMDVGYSIAMGSIAMGLYMFG